MINTRSSDGTTRPVKRNRARIHVIEDQMGLISERNCRVVHSNSPFTIGSGVQEGRLHEHVLLISHQRSPLRSIIGLHFTFKLVDQDSILVNDWTEDQIRRLFLNQFVSVCACLIETCRGSNAEDGLPSATPRQTIVQFVGEL